MALPTVPYIQITIPPVRGVQPTIWNMEYQGDGEWYAFLAYEFSGSQGEGIYPLVYSTRYGFLFPAMVGQAGQLSDEVHSTSFNRQLSLIGIYSDGASPYYFHFGFYKTNQGTINLANAPFIDAGLYAMTDNMNNFAAQNTIAYDGEFGITSCPLDTLVKSEYDMTFLSLSNPNMAPFGTGIISLNDSDQILYWPSITNIMNPLILKTYSASDSLHDFKRLGNSGFSVYYFDSDDNYFFDLFLTPKLYLEKIPFSPSVLDKAAFGNGYVITADDVYAVIETNPIGTIDTTILSDNAEYFLIGDNILCAYEGNLGGPSFWLYTLPPLPPLLPFYFNLQRNFAYNYSRGVPVNYSPENLILPPNTNVIL